MGFVASFKNPLEIAGVLPPVFNGTGGGDEANNEGQAGSYQSDRGSVSRREQKREEQDSGPVCEPGGSEGYVAREDVYQFAQSFGFQPAQIRVALNRCLEKRLLATPTSLKGDDYSRIRVTTVGAYTIKKLMFMFAYLDAIIIDTPIVDANFRLQIDDVATTEERFERALVFLSYLETQWSKLDQSVAETFDWAASAAEARSTIEAIRTRWKETVARRRT